MIPRLGASTHPSYIVVKSQVPGLEPLSKLTSYLLYEMFADISGTVIV